MFPCTTEEPSAVLLAQALGERAPSLHAEPSWEASYISFFFFQETTQKCGKLKPGLENSRVVPPWF